MPDTNNHNIRIFGLLLINLVICVILGASLNYAKVDGQLFGVKFYITGPMAVYIFMTMVFYKCNLFNQGLSREETDQLLNSQIDTLNDIVQIENMIIDLKGRKQRIDNRIARLERAMVAFDENSPQESFTAMGITPARRGG